MNVQHKNQEAQAAAEHHATPDLREPAKDFAKQAGATQSRQLSWLGRWARRVLWCGVIGILLYFFVAPAWLVLEDIQQRSRGYGSHQVPARAYKMHTSLTPGFALWAKRRVASGAAKGVGLYDIAGTEWPVFSATFYLWATRRLQSDFDASSDRSGRVSPMHYAREAVEAAKDLLLDPNHHSWVRRHWGKDYMKRKNVFFRSLLIGGLTSYEKLTKSGKYIAMLREQVTSLVGILDRSKYGVLDDYPNECYPIDVFAAIGVLKAAADFLKIDLRPFLKREIRAFSGKMLDKHGLVPYRMDEKTAMHVQPSRGIGNSHYMIFAPELWPKRAKVWYQRYEKHFWQELWWAHGFLEYARGSQTAMWDYDIDAGPVIAGFSTSGSAFGIAAARRNGRLDHAYTLSAQAFAVSWPLPGGTLLGPRLLSSGAGAPYLGESAIMFFLSTTPAKGVKRVTGGSVTPLVWMILLFWVIVGIGGIAFAIRQLRILRA